MENFTLVLDESGAKGYASTTERSVGEIGVMAGFCYAEDYINIINRNFTRYISSYIGSLNGKFHITDLPSDKQNEFRELVFDIARELNLQWFFSAVYAQGFHESEFSDNRGRGDKKNSLHTTLFRNLLNKSLSLVYSLDKKQIQLNVVTDTVSSGVLKQFEATSLDVRRMFLGENHEFFVKRWDPESKKVSKTTICSSISSEGLPRYDELEIKIACEESVLTIIADVLANSVLYYLNENRADNLKNDLNSKTAVAGHPLSDLLLAPKTVEEYFPVLDVIYRREST
ncbi:hypothetical protein [Vibrio owensii]|uniref:hypothetical protein n=1 Tax=Vibrio owensii TaxID=696485 RepID=UPI0018F109C5|nr:hypothetical protein [Vibrio owensii]